MRRSGSSGLVGFRAFTASADRGRGLAARWVETSGKKKKKKKERLTGREKDLVERVFGFLGVLFR